MQVLEKSKGICVVPESLYCYHYKEAENLVNRFHENYYEALLYFRDRTWQCFRNASGKAGTVCGGQCLFRWEESDVSA